MNILPSKKSISTSILRLIMICAPLVGGGAGGGLLCSCGDYYVSGDPIVTRKMTLGRKMINLTVGDRYMIPVLFDPDTLTNRTVWWHTEDPDVAVFEQDSVVGIGEGLTLVYALSVSERQLDSCWVNVLPLYYMNPYQYPYDMLIYADVNIHGHHYTAADEDSLIIAAYVDNELRGIGKMMEWQGMSYMEIRVWSPVRYGEEVRLHCYYRGQGLAERFPDVFEFDGNAYGTLSNLYPLVLDDNAVQLWPALDDDDFPYFEEPDTLHTIVTNTNE